MSTYALPTPLSRPEAKPKTLYTVASGDLRPSANVKCWPTQRRLEEDFAAAAQSFGWSIERAHPFDEQKGHGFIDSQRAGIEVFKNIPADAPVVVVDAVWQYSHHVLPGLRTHRGPILVVANWAGDFPGLVGLLGLTGSMTKAQVDYSALWSADFTDAWARAKLGEWLETGTIEHDQSHVRDLPALDPESPEVELGTALARQVARGIVPPPDDDVLADRYVMADETLTAAGFEWYEVSNWATSEAGRCQHNELYWRDANWWGFGPGAHSHVGDVRWWNVKHPARYAALVESGASPAAGRETLDERARFTERVMLGVRLREGLSMDDLPESAEAVARQLAGWGLIEHPSLSDGRIVLTQRGRLMADAVVRELLG